MADTLVERLTGQTHAADVNIELHLLMRLDTLIDPDPDKDTAAVLAGQGPLPAELTREIRPPVGDVNGGAASSPHQKGQPEDRSRLWVAIRPGGTSTAG
jgi:hypothetical protein